MNRRLNIGLILGFATAMPFSAKAEDGYRLWLRYDQLAEQPTSSLSCRTHFRGVPLRPWSASAASPARSPA
jgi:hypothetical protein